MAKQPTVESAPVIAKKLDRVVYPFEIVGDTPLIVNRWSEKARKMMLDAQQTKARQKKQAKDPAANFEASKYKLKDGSDAFPATAFKAAIVHAGRLFEGITQVFLKQTVLVVGDGLDARGDSLVRLEFDECLMREDTPRNANGVADLRYRAQYNGWRATINVQVIDGLMDPNSLGTLVDAAGIGGVGEWRPTAPKSATGTYGTFHVKGLE